MIKNKIKLEARIENWRNILYDFIKINLEKLQMDENLLEKILLSCEEIYVNIPSYAYSARKIGEAEVYLEFDNKEVKITFIDQGISFNPMLVPNPDTKSSASDRRIGGWGIFIVKKLMDKVEYKRENGKNFLTITKFLNFGGK